LLNQNKEGAMENKSNITISATTETPGAETPLYYIGIDIGGTRIKSVVIDNYGNMVHKAYNATNDGEGAAWKQAVLRLTVELRSKFNIQHFVAGLSAPGLPGKDNRSIACMPGRLQGLENFVWGNFLGGNCFVLNDAVAAMAAEAKCGAAITATNAVMVTVGTGVGGALLINKEIYQGSFNKAGHIGHTVIDSDGSPDVTGMPGSLEECIGNCTLQKRSGGKFSSTQQMLEAAGNGDFFAKNVWGLSVKKLALALASASNLLSPDMIVIGGGIAEAGDALFVPLNKWFDEFEWQPGGIRPQIVKAVHGDIAGALGAAFFAKNQYEKKVQ
jgi:glucokinase